jgi:hypothetical protein
MKINKDIEILKKNAIEILEMKNYKTEYQGLKTR